jgi:hypothetical protein
VTARSGARTPASPAPNDAELQARAAAHLRALASEPRPTGGAAATAARDYCAGVLASRGYKVVERPFEYSAAVGELGTPAGGIAMLLIVAGAWAAASAGQVASALGLLVGGLVVVALVGGWLARRGILELPLFRRRGVNLEALPAAGAPRVWLVAHIDSKSQPISLVVRAVGVTLLALAWIVALLAILGALAGVSLAAWRLVVVMAVIGAVPVIASVVGRRSPGAVDNASGVATVLIAAELSAADAVGVLITDAEELGLAGARAWCAATEREQIPVLNCDGIDDVGMLTLMWTRRRAHRIEQLVRAAAASTGERLRVIPLISGVLVDGLAFSDAGWDCMTLSRGSLETLRRIHTTRDNLDRLRGTGVAAASRVLAAAAHTLAEHR